MQIDRWLCQPHLGGVFPLPLDAPFTMVQARAAGLPRRWLLLLTEAGQLRHPLKNCYLSAHLADDIGTRSVCL